MQGHSAYNLSQYPLDSESEQSVWYSVSSVEQLQAAYVLNIQGNLICSTLHLDRLDSESEAIVSQLTKLNLFGCITVNSQPHRQYVSYTGLDEIIQRPYLVCWYRTEHVHLFVEKLRELHPTCLVSLTHNAEQAPEVLGLENFSVLGVDDVVPAHLNRKVGTDDPFHEDFFTSVSPRDNEYEYQYPTIPMARDTCGLTLLNIITPELSNKFFDDCVKSAVFVLAKLEDLL
jgi:hypothetical protein